MATAVLDTAPIRDWDTFHDACRAAFGFPDFYGRNGNAFIDCLNYIDEGDGMSRFHLAPGETLTIEVHGAGGFIARAPEQALALFEWVGDVNENFLDQGKPAPIVLQPR
jgi:hypothetical protein